MTFPGLSKASFERGVLAALLLAFALGCAAALAADAVDGQRNQEASAAREAPEFKKTLARPTLESEQGLPARPASPGTASLLRLGLGLAVVMVLLFGLMVLLRRMGYGQGTGSGAIEILASRSLGPRERVVLIRSGERHLLLGVAPGRVAPLDQWVSTFQEFDQ